MYHQMQYARCTFFFLSKHVCHGNVCPDQCQSWKLAQLIIPGIFGSEIGWKVSTGSAAFLPFIQAARCKVAKAIQASLSMTEGPILPTQNTPTYSLGSSQFLLGNEENAELTEGCLHIPRSWELSKPDGSYRNWGSSLSWNSALPLRQAAPPQKSPELSIFPRKAILGNSASCYLWTGWDGILKPPWGTEWLCF